MQYIVSLNQERMLEWNLNMNEAALMDLICHAAAWAKPITVEGGVWYWLSHKKLCAELPAIFHSASALRAALRSIDGKGLIERTQCGNMNLVRLTERGKGYVKSAGGVRIQTPGCQDSDTQGCQDSDTNQDTKDQVTNINNPPTPQGGRDALFDEFWQAYPKKVGKDAARKAFAKRKPDRVLLDGMLRAVWRQRRSEQWTRESGRFIPNPATWLNQGRWQDEPPGLAAANDEYPGTIPHGVYM